MSKGLTIALTKGRILQETLPLLAAAGIELTEDPKKSRKLIFDTNHPDIHVVIIRGVDVPTYVQFGAADIGVAGRDILLEDPSDRFYELVDLGIAKCRLMTAALVGKTRPQGRLRVATKFTHSAKRWYASKGIQVELIKLYGAMELAPLMNLADEIVDIVDTGNTLKANGLEPRENIADISSRLIVNKASMRVNHDRIMQIADKIQQAVNND